MPEDYEEDIQTAVWDMFVKCKDDYSVKREIVACLHDAHDSIWRLRQNLSRAEEQSVDAHSILSSGPMAWLIVGSSHHEANWRIITEAVRRYWSRYGGYFKDTADPNAPRAHLDGEPFTVNTETSEIVSAAIEQIGLLKEQIHALEMSVMGLWAYAFHDETCPFSEPDSTAECTCGFAEEEMRYNNLDCAQRGINNV